MIESKRTLTSTPQLHGNGDPLIAHSGDELPLVAADLHQAVLLHGLQGPRQVGLLAAGAFGKLGQRLRCRPANRLLQLAVFRFEGARLQPCRKLPLVGVALATEGLRWSAEVRVPSGAEARLPRPRNGAAEAAPLQNHSPHEFFSTL